MKLQRKVPETIKRILYEQAGNKCANPGCANWRTHIHHIKHWAVYRSHETPDLIAVCPTCHDQIHYGILKITDEDLYRWKRIVRTSGLDTGIIYVEAADELRIIAGKTELVTKHDVVVFSLSNENRLKIRVLDGSFLQVTSCFQKLDGTQILRVVENHVRVKSDPDVSFDYRQGRASVTVPASQTYIPTRALEWMRRNKTEYASNDRITLFDLQVISPGVIKVEGLWHSVSGDVIITGDDLNFIGDNFTVCFRNVAQLHFPGEITRQMFSFR